METDHASKLKKVLVLVTIIVLISLICLAAYRMYYANLHSYAVEATKLGVEASKQKCRSNGLSNDICNSIQAVDIASSTECQGEPCWIVNAHASNPDDFRSNLVVVEDSGEYKLLDYQENTTKKE